MQRITVFADIVKKLQGCVTPAEENEKKSKDSRGGAGARRMAAFKSQ
jgi:hypothetical protein